jgi:hypothetical protein
MKARLMKSVFGTTQMALLATFIKRDGGTSQSVGRYNGPSSFLSSSSIFHAYNVWLESNIIHVPCINLRTTTCTHILCCTEGLKERSAGLGN